MISNILKPKINHYNPRGKLLLILDFVFLFSSVSFAYDEVKIIASDGAPGDLFGTYVSISEDYAIVGAPHDCDNGINSGSAYIFKQTGTNWYEQAKIMANDGNAYDIFGTCVSISGDYAIVGAPYDDDSGSCSGSAYIFERDGEQWNQVVKLMASDAAVDDKFGCSVSISGDYAIVGSCFHGDVGVEGAAYIFKRARRGWHEQVKIMADDAPYWREFGHSVSISGDYAIVGAPGDSTYVDSVVNGDTIDYYANAGSAYIFKRYDTQWRQVVKIRPSDGAAQDYWFGLGVSISGDYAIIGTPGDDDKGEQAGSAYIFKRDGISWGEQAKIMASDGAPQDHFGGSVSFSGDYAIVGALFDDDKGLNSGSAYIFKRNETNWHEQAKIMASDGAPQDHFGGSVSLSGDYAIVGALFDDDNGDKSGSAYIYSPITVVEEGDRFFLIPSKTMLANVYPNPFSKKITIAYQVSKHGEVDLMVYDVSGQLVRNFQIGMTNSGYYKVMWDGKDNIGCNVPAGIYFVRFTVDDYEKIEKIVLFR
jgi:hypothetical protein